MQLGRVQVSFALQMKETTEVPKRRRQAKAKKPPEKYWEHAWVVYGLSKRDAISGLLAFPAGIHIVSKFSEQLHLSDYVTRVVVGWRAFTHTLYMDLFAWLRLPFRFEGYQLDALTLAILSVGVSISSLVLGRREGLMTLVRRVRTEENARVSLLLAPILFIISFGMIGIFVGDAPGVVRLFREGTTSVSSFMNVYPLFLGAIAPFAAFYVFHLDSISLRKADFVLQVSARVLPAAMVLMWWLGMSYILLQAFLPLPDADGVYRYSMEASLLVVICPSAVLLAAFVNWRALPMVLLNAMLIIFIDWIGRLITPVLEYIDRTLPAA